MGGDFQAALAPDVPAPRIGIHTARRSTATATTTGATSTRRRAWSPGPPAARCSSRARWSTRLRRTARGTSGLRFELIGEIGLKGFSEPVELFHAFPREE